jgi:NAD(P)-dependent dehydrogenase (short-subunit alcohol dehydrogenase family)
MSSPVVLITGALTGIGRATALAFANEGARVVVSGRHDEEGKNLVAEVRKLGAEAEFIRADVRHEEDVRKLIDKTVERFGRLDVAVNNAGTEGKPGPVTQQTAESYAATFDTNVLGTLLSMKASSPRMTRPMGEANFSLSTFFPSHWRPSSATLCASANRPVNKKSLAKRRSGSPAVSNVPARLASLMRAAAGPNLPRSISNSRPTAVTEALLGQQSSFVRTFAPPPQAFLEARVASPRDGPIPVPARRHRARGVPSFTASF